MFGRISILGVSCLTLIVLCQSFAEADVAYIVSTPAQSAISAKIIVKGEVKSIEKDLVEVSPFPNAPKETPKIGYRIAILKLKESLVGAKGLTEIRVGYRIGLAVVGEDRPRKRPPVIGTNAPELEVGDEGYFMLVPHFEGDFYVYSGRFSSGPLLTKNPNTEKELPTLKKIATVLKDPVSYLKSKETEERFYALAILTNRYREGNPSDRSKAVEIPKEETQLLLDVLSEIPFDPKLNGVPPKTELFTVLLNENLNQLGFKYPMAKPGEDIAKLYEQSLNEFIKANREKIVLKKWVQK